MIQQLTIEAKKAREGAKPKKSKNDQLNMDDLILKTKFSHLPSETYEKDFTSRSKDR
jgi:hypothetical protein